jgi:hypothetical protein
MQIKMAIEYPDDYLRRSLAGRECWRHRQAPHVRTSRDVRLSGFFQRAHVYRQRQRCVRKQAFGIIRESEARALSRDLCGIRTGAELAAVLANNPFSSAAPNQTVAIFLDAPPPANVLDTVSGQQTEEIAVGTREIYVHYKDGIARSKLKIPAAGTGTARNMNTVAKLAEWTAD